MIGFKHLIEAFEPLDMMACATSAMREAENGPEICNRILTEASIKVEIIDGVREAQFIFESASAVLFSGMNKALFKDGSLRAIDFQLSTRPGRLQLIEDGIFRQAF